MIPLGFPIPHEAAASAAASLYQEASWPPHNSRMITLTMNRGDVHCNVKWELLENPRSSHLVPPLGIEPGPSEPESEILSFKLQGQKDCKYTNFRETRKK